MGDSRAVVVRLEEWEWDVQERRADRPGASAIRFQALGEHADYSMDGGPSHAPNNRRGRKKSPEKEK